VVLGAVFSHPVFAPEHGLADGTAAGTTVDTLWVLIILPALTNTLVY
jgi:hypothetical protein